MQKMEKKIKGYLKIRILLGSIIKGEKVSDKDLELILQEIIRNDNVKEWSDSEKETALQFSVIMFAKFADKIETLRLQFLKLSLEALYNAANPQYLAVILKHAVNELNMGDQTGIELAITSCEIIRKTMNIFDDESFISSSPDVLSVILLCIIGKRSKKERILKECIKTIQAYFEKLTMRFISSIKSIIKKSEKLKLANSIRDVHGLPADIAKVLRNSTDSNQQDYTKQESQIKLILDNIFQVYLQLNSPLDTDSQISAISLLPTLSLSMLEVYLKHFVELQRLLSGFEGHPLMDSILPDLIFLTSSLLPELPDFIDNMSISRDKLRMLLKSVSKAVRRDEVKCKLQLCRKAIQAVSSELERSTILDIKTIRHLVGFKVNNIEILGNLFGGIGALSAESKQIDDVSQPVPFSKDYMEFCLRKTQDYSVYLIKEFLPAYHFEDELILDLQTLINTGGSTQLLFQLLASLEDFCKFTQSIQYARDRICSISEYTSQSREMITVDDPLEDIITSLFCLSSTVQNYATSVEMDSIEQLCTDVKSSLEVYLTAVNMIGYRKKIYSTLIYSLVAMLVIKCNVKRIESYEQAKKYPKMAWISKQIFFLLSIPDGCESLSEVVGLCLRIFCQKTQRVCANSPYHTSLSQFNTLQGFMAGVSQQLIDNAKYMILNSASLPVTLTNLYFLTNMAKISCGANTDSTLALSLVPFLVNFLDVVPHQLVGTLNLTLQKLLHTILKSLLPVKNKLKEDAERLIAEGASEKPISNAARKLGLKMFTNVAAVKNDETTEVLLLNMHLFLEIFQDVPMAVEDKDDHFSGGEPDNCSIENTAAAFFAEIWDSIRYEVEMLAYSCLLIEDSLGSLLYEFMIMKSKSREKHLLGLLRRHIFTIVPKCSNMDDIQNAGYESISKLSQLLPKKYTLKQPNHSRSFLLTELELLSKISLSSTSFFNFEARSAPLIPVLCLVIALNNFDSVGMIKTAIKAVEILKIVKPNTELEIETAAAVITWAKLRGQALNMSGAGKERYWKRFEELANEVLINFSNT